MALSVVTVLWMCLWTEVVSCSALWKRMVVSCMMNIFCGKCRVLYNYLPSHCKKSLNAYRSLSSGSSDAFRFPGFVPRRAKVK